MSMVRLLYYYVDCEIIVFIVFSMYMVRIICIVFTMFMMRSLLQLFSHVHCEIVVRIVFPMSIVVSMSALYFPCQW
jgi:hypothetical protein